MDDVVSIPARTVARRPWPVVRRWRRRVRARLLERRLALPGKERRRLAAEIAAVIDAEVMPLLRGCVALYWPIKGEPDLRPLAIRLRDLGRPTALPVVLAAGTPLVFRDWGPETQLVRGVWNIPVPAEGRPLRPDVVFAPLLGFDGAGYRLGYGGGYYDRTLASLSPKPLTIGVGYELGRLPTVHPQPHDIPMDAIVTEAGLHWIRAGAAGREARACEMDEDPNSRPSYASPPCFMHELDPSYLGYMGRDELLDLLNTLLEAERAGARGVAALARRHPAGPVHQALHDVAIDEARFCAMLTRHVRRLGGRPSGATGSFYGKLLKQPDLGAELRLLDRGQGWVADRLREALGRIQDDALHADLREMLETHERNIARCAALRA